MVKYIDELFLTEKTEKKLNRIKKDIENKKWFSKVCLITLASNNTDVFDIIQLYNLRTCPERYEDVTILGIAENKGAAMELCAAMSNEYIFDTNEYEEKYENMRDYFLKRYINR